MFFASSNRRDTLADVGPGASFFGVAGGGGLAPTGKEVALERGREGIVARRELGDVRDGLRTGRLLHAGRFAQLG